MDRYVSYRQLLREAKDESGRRLIQKLLTEEEQKQIVARTSALAIADNVIK